MLVHLKRAGKLDGIAGLMIGEMHELEDSQSVPFGATVEEIALGLIGDAPIPIVSNFPTGHGGRQMTLPIGATVRLACTPDQPVCFEIL